MCVVLTHEASAVSIVADKVQLRLHTTDVARAFPWASNCGDASMPKSILRGVDLLTKLCPGYKRSSLASFAFRRVHVLKGVMRE